MLINIAGPSCSFSLFFFFFFFPSFKKPLPFPTTTTHSSYKMVTYFNSTDLARYSKTLHITLYTISGRTGLQYRNFLYRSR